MAGPCEVDLGEDLRFFCTLDVESYSQEPFSLRVVVLGSQSKGNHSQQEQEMELHE